MRLTTLSTTLASCVALAVATGCGAPSSAGGAACSGTGSCGAGLCVVGSCRPAESTPAPEGARRFVIAPRDLSVLSSAESFGVQRGVPDAIAVGRDDAGETVVLLRFSAALGDATEITSAFVVLDPTEGAPLARRPLTVEVARILEPWTSSTASWGRMPRLSLPVKVAPIRPQPTAAARVDVTSIVREWAARRPDDHGIALLITGDDALGATYSMGVSDGSGPHLEVYAR